MLNSSTSTVRSLHLLLKGSFGSYFKAVQFFTQMQATAGSHKKKEAIIDFKKQQTAEDLKQFDRLVNFANTKSKLGISSKIVCNYYLKTYVSAAQTEQVGPKLVEGGIMREISENKQKESQLSLYDVNLFIKYLVALTGTGSQTEKASKIIELGKKISVAEGIYLLKILDRKLTIGAGSKTFKKTKITVEPQKQPQIKVQTSHVQ